MKKINKLIKKKLSSGNVMAILDQVKKNYHLFKKADGFKREMGNGLPSEFSDMKFFKFPREMKEIVKDNMPQEWRGHANEIWLLKFEKGESLQEKQLHDMCFFHLESIALSSGNKFNLGNKELTLNAGDMIKFSPTIKHSVTNVSNTDYYLVALIMPVS